MTEIKLMYADMLNIKDENFLAEALEHLKEKRRQKVMACKCESDRKRSVAAGILLENACRLWNVAEASIEIGEHGKPYMESERSFLFNLSHSGQFVVCASTIVNNMDSELGVDVQEVRSMNASMEQRILTEFEQKALPQNTKERQRMLNRYWNVKESYCKMIGLGLSYDMRKGQIDWKSNTVFDLQKTFPSGYFYEFPLGLGEKYFTTVCFSNPIAKENISLEENQL